MEKIVSEFLKLDTSTVSDALDKLGINGQCLGIKPTVVSWKIAGRAFTVKYGPVGLEKGTVGDYIDDVPEGSVVVLDNQGRLDCTVWGDILTGVAARRGIAGTVIDGCCRDTKRSLELDYPIFSASRYMRTGKDRVQVDSVGAPLSISGVRIRSSDIMLADADGVVAIPDEVAEKVLETAKAIENAENRIREATEKGQRLDEARAAFGYHKLQSK